MSHEENRSRVRLGSGLARILGRALIALWVGPAFEFAATALTILALGELLPSTQYVTTNVIQAKARHRALAYTGCVEAPNGLS